MKTLYHIYKIGIIYIIASIVFPSCQLSRFVFYNFADINDHKKFQSRPLTAHDSPYSFYNTTAGKAPTKLNGIPFDKYLEDNKTVAI